jgi:hypothetical protein
MGVIEREAGAPPVGENDRFIVEREKARAGGLWTHSLVEYELPRLPFGDCLAIEAMSLGEDDVCLLTRLNCASNSWRRRRTGMRSPSRRLSWFSRDSRFPGSTCNRRQALKRPIRERSVSRDDSFARSCPMQDNNPLARREPAG